MGRNAVLLYILRNFILYISITAFRLISGNLVFLGCGQNNCSLSNFSRVSFYSISEKAKKLEALIRVASILYSISVTNYLVLKLSPTSFLRSPLVLQRIKQRRRQSLCSWIANGARLSCARGMPWAVRLSK